MKTFILTSTLFLAVSAQFEDLTLNVGDLIDYAQDVQDHGYKSFEVSSKGPEGPTLKKWNEPIYDPHFNGAIRARSNGLEEQKTSVPMTLISAILVVLAITQFGQILTAAKYGKILLWENPLFDNFFDDTEEQRGLGREMIEMLEKAHLIHELLEQ